MQIISRIKAISLVTEPSFSPHVAKGLICIPLLSIGFANTVKAGPGDLDTSFGVDGKVTTGFGVVSFARDEAIAMIQTDGKVTLS